MKSLILIFLLLILLAGCASQFDTASFSCKSRCGWYDTDMNMFGTFECMNDCINSGN